jgi:hypothetical protein
MITSYEIEQRLSNMKKSFVPEIVLAYIRLQHNYGLRIGDMLKIDCNSIMSDYSIIVNQSKGSKQLIIYPRADFDIWKMIKDSHARPMENYSRFSMYRLYRKFGISLPTDGKKNASVTKSARKIKAQQVYNDTKSLGNTAQALGHKRTSSTMYYLSDDQKRLEAKNGILTNPKGCTQGIRVNKNGVIRFVTDI